jgi:hypothetical protein
MTTIKAARVSGQKPSHEGCQWGGISCSQEKVGMMRYQSPGITGHLGFGNEILKTGQKVILVVAVPEYSSSLNASYTNVVENTGSVSSG